ncbi:MAG: hypothetical protein ABI551_25595 [Polyangiaceae bacterium]
MSLHHALPFVALLPVLAFAACGGSTDSNSGAPSADAGDVADAGASVGDDAGADTGIGPIDSTYPSQHPAIPIVNYNGGPVLHAMHVVTITVDGDTMRDDLERFGQVITKTPWWDAVRADYCDSSGGCVGQGDAGPVVHLAPADLPSTSFTDSSQGQGSTLQDYLTSLINSGKVEAPGVDTLYAFYFPSATYSITLDGSGSCSSFGGYHNSYSYPGNAVAGDGGIGGVTVQYAVVPRCGDEEETTVAASHEFIEAATDPHVGSQNTIAYYMTNLAWSIEGGEVGDVCVGRNDEYQESGFAVQRSWSNTAAKASHDPCVPAPANEAYFNTAYSTNSLASMKVGDTKTIQLTAFSDAPTDDWTLRATDYAQQYGGTASLDIQLDKPTANNGTKINMTIKVLAAPPKNFGGYALFSISSKNATDSHRWPGAILIH